MNWLTRWHLLERFWEPVRRQLFLARQLRTERDYFQDRLAVTEQVAEHWKKHAEEAGLRLDRILYPPLEE